MQSFLQYRRFRTAVKAQLERDKAKAEGLRYPRREDTSNSSSGDSQKEDYEKDVERGDFATDSHRNSSHPHHPAGVNAGDADPNIGPPLPGEEKKIMRKDQRPEEFGEPAEDKEEPAEEEDEDEDFEMHAARTVSRTTQHTVGTALGNALTGIEIRRRTTHEGGEGNVFVVGYEENDPNDPHNWSNAKRFGATFMVASIGCVVGMASAIDSSALKEAAAEFHVSEVAETLATGLFLIGFGAGSLVAGPISETVGRNPVYLVTLALYMVFIMASALAPNFGSQLAFRFIAGCFAATPLTCAGGSVSDMWNPMERTFAFPVFANAAFTGPLIGPVIGGFIAESSLVSWRWVEWITLIISGLVTALVFFFQPETYPQILLKWKAQHLRELTGDDRYKAPIEIREESFFHRLRRALYRPFLLTIREPIIVLVALYLTVIYIVLFGFLFGFDYIFGQIHGTSEGITGLCFLSVIIGLFGATALVPLIYKWAKQALRDEQAKGNDHLPPEFRLWYSMLGGSIAMPVSLFWMAWTSDPNISIWSPLAAAVLFGYGILCVFITSYQYIIDTYETFAASALASITLIRYVVAGGMTVVAIPWYENLGVHYTLTMLACFSAMLVPVPYVFYKYGHWIRSKSKYAVVHK